MTAGLALKMQFNVPIHSNHRSPMKKLFTPFFIILLLITAADKTFGESPLKYDSKLNFRFADFLSADFKYLSNPIYTLNRVPQIWELQLDMNKDAEIQGLNGTKPVLNLGSIPEALLKYQSDTVLQWGHTLRDITLLLRIGIGMEDFKPIDNQDKPENSYILNFMIDFWFK